MAGFYRVIHVSWVNQGKSSSHVEYIDLGINTIDIMQFGNVLRVAGYA
jgi:hypothetical protein